MKIESSFTVAATRARMRLQRGRLAAATSSSGASAPDAFRRAVAAAKRSPVGLASAANRQDRNETPFDRLERLQPFEHLRYAPCVELTFDVAGTHPALAPRVVKMSQSAFFEQQRKERTIS